MKKNPAQFRLRLHHGDTIAIGPGKVSLLEAIDRTGSISAAAREIGMSYRRAWVLIDEMNQALRQPPLETLTGGAGGGGSTLSASGRAVVQHYREAEARALQACAKEIGQLNRLIKP